MRTYNTVYFLLFVLLIMGAFASMAQNNYGLKLLGIVALAFGTLFLYQLYAYVKQDGRKKEFVIVELVCLTTLSICYALNVFNNHHPLVEKLFLISCIVLGIVYFRKMILAYAYLTKTNKVFALLIIVFYLSIIAFIVAIATWSYAVSISRTLGVIALVLVGVFLIVALVKGKFLINDRHQSAFGWIIGERDRSGLLVSLFSVAAIYIGLSSAGMLPQLYVDELPQAYYKQQGKASSGSEVTQNSKQKQEQFKLEYEKFIERNALAK